MGWLDLHVWAPGQGGDLAQSGAVSGPRIGQGGCRTPDTTFPVPADVNTPHILPASTCGSRGVGDALTPGTEDPPHK